MSAAVIVVETGSLAFVEVFEGLRRCWLRGLVLAGALALGVLATILAFRFYGDAGTLAWPLAVLVLYLAGIFALYQLVLWPLAIRRLRSAAARGGDRGRPRARAAARERRSGSGSRSSSSTSPGSSPPSFRS